MKRAVLVAAGAVVLAANPWLGRHDAPLSVAAFDIAHVVLGFAVSRAAGLAVPARFAWWRRAGAALATGALVGVAIEGLQFALASGRPSLADLAFDALGTIAAIATLPASAAPGQASSRMARVARIAVVAVAAGVPVFYFAAVMAHESLRTERLPGLESFESPLSLLAWTAVEGARAARTSQNATDGRHALRCDFSPGRRPAVAFLAPAPDWRPYGLLRADVFVEGSLPVNLSVKVTDEIAWREIADRFERAYPLQPGPNVLRIELEDVAQGPRERRLDLGQIKSVVFAIRNATHPSTLFLDDLALEEHAPAPSQHGDSAAARDAPDGRR